MKKMKTCVSIVTAVFFLGIGRISLAAAPNNDPIAAKYPGAYPWTSNIHWTNIFPIGAPDASGNYDTAYAIARDLAANAGGGVVYFPTGTYNFTAPIQLKNGVVIR